MGNLATAQWIAIGCVVYFAERWVLGPIIRIGESLTTGSLEPIRGLYEVKSEMGRVARMVQKVGVTN